MFKFQNKNILFRYFCARILKQYCHVLNQHPRFCLIENFCKNVKILKFGTKNTLFGYFYLKTLKKYFHMLNQHSQICLTTKFCEKTKLPKIRNKNNLLGFVGTKLKLLSYLKSAPLNLSN